MERLEQCHAINRNIVTPLKTLKEGQYAESFLFGRWGDATLEVEQPGLSLFIFVLRKNAKGQRWCPKYGEHLPA
jgi:uncharacterized protein (DUF2141 family)